MSFVTFRTQRQALLAGVVTPITPPIATRVVEIGNAGSDDLKVYSVSGDESTYFVVAAGYAKVLELSQFRFYPSDIAFYLKAVADMTAVLIWK